MENKNYKIAILTVSDKGYAGQREDLSGKVIAEFMSENGYEVAKKMICPDDYEMIRDCLIALSDEEEIMLVLTTGGTGFSTRDVTPEATQAVIEKACPGIAVGLIQNSLKYTDRAILSRQTAGIRKNTLIINLPGSPKACRENLEFLVPPLRHGLEILCFGSAECARKDNETNDRSVFN